VGEDTTSPAFDLLPSEQRGERESANERLIRTVLILAVIALVLVALGLPVYQKREAVIALLPQIAKAKQEAESTDVLVRSLERQVTDYNFMQGKRHAPGALAFIEDLSRLLPDNTWVQQFDLRTAGKGREVQITGETVSSSRLIELLEQSTLLQNSAPRGTVTRGSQPGTERFMIAAEARQKPLPEAVPAREVALPTIPPPQPVAAAVPPAPAPATTADAEAAGEGEPKAEVSAAPPKAAPVPARVEPVARPPRPAPSPESKAQADERARRVLENREKLLQERTKRMEEARARRQQQPQQPPQQRGEQRR
jgi:predicted transcriptional regulator